MLPLPFTEPELYHGSGPAYFGSLVTRKDQKPIHACYPVEELPTWLRMVDPNLDTYVSQAEFFMPKRRIATLRSIGLVWADCGDDEKLAELGESGAIHRILKCVDEATIPEPSVIVSSGRGFHPKWLFERAVPSQALPRWSALERTITDALRKPLYADPRSTDATRVLRVAGTVNTRNGKVAHIAYRRDVNGQPLRYNFDQLCRDVLKRERPGTLTEQDRLPRTKQRRAATGFQTYTIGTLWWGRLFDLRRLCELRGWTRAHGGVPVGYRDLVLFFFAVALSWVTFPAKWWEEVLAIATQYTPTLKDHEQRSFVGTAYRRMCDTRERGTEHDKRYRYTTARIISDLDISVEEMKTARLEHLLLPEMIRARKHEANARNMARVRADESEAVKVKRAIRDEKIRRMHNEGASITLISSTLGVSRPTVYAALQEDE